MPLRFGRVEARLARLDLPGEDDFFTRFRRDGVPEVGLLTLGTVILSTFGDLQPTIVLEDFAPFSAHRR